MVNVQVQASQSVAHLRSTPLWILAPGSDLALFVATPLLIFPVAMALQQGMSIEEIGLYVAAFGATGHHVPGMMRAYGDHELFARFKARFIAAPIFLFGICLLFYSFGLKGIEFVLLLWGLWHGLAQVYGFERIYDGKVKSGGTLIARLDMAMCVAWFGAGFLHSPDRTSTFLTVFYAAGGPLLPAVPFETFLTSWMVGTAAITVAFLANYVWRFIEGHPQSPVKLLLMASSFGFWWYTMNGIGEVILGIAMFEVFHDVQYLAIVWVFNRRRVDEGTGLSAFMRFAFRRSGLLIGVYIGAVFAYGSITFLPKNAATPDAVRDVLLALVSASALLHFYFDGFIWKVRESSTAKRLGVEGRGTDANDSATRGRGPFARWSLLVVPLALAALGQSRGIPDEFARLHNIATLAPGAHIAQFNLGVIYAQRGELTEAVDRYERALAIKPNYDIARINLGTTLHERGDSRGAKREFERALRQDENSSNARNNLAWILATDLDPAVRSPGEAVRLAEEAATASLRENASVLDTLAVAYAAAERYPQAIATAERALALAHENRNDALVSEITKRLTLFRDHLPYYE